MKNIFTLLILSMFSISAFGQLNFYWEHDTIEIDKDFELDAFDLAIDSVDTTMDGNFDSTVSLALNHLLNESTATTFRWSFTKLVPDNWIVQLCDEDNCYLETVTAGVTNIPTSYNYKYKFQIVPNNTSGSGVIDLNIWPESDNTDIRTTHYSVVGNLLSTGVFEFSLLEIDVYPNPSSEFINIVTGGNELFMSSSVLNQSGQELLRSDITEGQLDIAELIPGTYVLSLNDENGQPRATKTFIKK